MTMYEWKAKVNHIQAEDEEEALLGIRLQIVAMAMASIEDLKRYYITLEDTGFKPTVIQ